MQADETPKYCEDCRWFRVTDSGLSNARCDAPQAGKRDSDRFLARELDKDPMVFATNMRGFEHNCGPAAKWFQPKTAEQVAA